MSKYSGLWEIWIYKELENGIKEEIYPKFQKNLSCSYKYWCKWIDKENSTSPKTSTTTLYTNANKMRPDVVIRAVTRCSNGDVIDRKLLSIDGREIKRKVGKVNEKEIGI